MSRSVSLAVRELFVAAINAVAYVAVFVVIARCVSANSVVASFIILPRLIIWECGVLRGIAAR